MTLSCHGFCTALSRHHVSEDVALFPELWARYPALRPTIAKLTEDHELIATLLTQFDRSLASAPAPRELSPHLEGLSAIMESHFQYEESQLLDTLVTLDPDADPSCLGRDRPMVIRAEIAEPKRWAAGLSNSCWSRG